MGHLIRYATDRQLIHGDPKFDNFLFVGRRAVALVDFDTLMRGSVLLDLGDALRSWCRKDGFVFDNRLFEEVVEAYRSEYRPPYTRDQIQSAIALITLELCARYVADAYEESYFNWDQEKYASAREHNTARAKDYFAFYRSVVGE
jgi:Ser/Thr protein kinase RdoA (MazF antagonist)